jgi:hypothetical protein
MDSLREMARDGVWNKTLRYATGFVTAQADFGTADGAVPFAANDEKEGF